MDQPRFIFFDVGNTVLFPNRQGILAPLGAGHQPTLDQWHATERKTKLEFDREMASGSVNHSFWRTFYGHLVNEVIPQMLPLRDRNQLIHDLTSSTQISANWNQCRPGTVEALDRLRANFRLAVISNADGKVAEVLDKCGLAHFFESITDSGTIGIEKPAAEIFHAALNMIGANAAESLYVGDIYSVDYVGATKAGMRAVLFDTCGAYLGRSEARVESLDQLEVWLRGSDGDSPRRNQGS